MAGRRKWEWEKKQGKAGNKTKNVSRNNIIEISLSTSLIPINGNGLNYSVKRLWNGSFIFKVPVGYLQGIHLKR